MKKQFLITLFLLQFFTNKSFCAIMHVIQAIAIDVGGLRPTGVSGNGSEHF